MGKKYGRERITYDLFQKGIKKDTIEEAYFIVEEEYEENMEEKKLEKAIERNQGKEKNKLIQYLVRQGFSLNKIFSKIKEYEENEKWKGEED